MNKTKLPRQVLKAFIMTAISLFLLVSISYAWYYGKISIGGGGLTTGKIGFVAYAYDENGTHQSTMVPTGMSTDGYTNVNAVIFTETGWKAGDASTAYICVERKGTIDIEFTVSFSASGANGALDNFMYLGGYWYEINEITSDLGNRTLEAYASSHKVVLCNETQCPNNKHTCTEKDGIGSYKNMSSIVTNQTTGVIKASPNEPQKRYYRIDYGVRKDATPEEYTSKKIELTANVYVTQVGAMQNPDGFGKEYTVDSAARLEEVIINSIPGDTVVFTSDVTYTGDLIINKALNLNLSSKTLTVKGNLIYDFNSEHNLTINLSGKGTIKVNMNGQVGGSFTLNTPNAQVEIIGTNTNGDLFVENICTLSSSNNPDKGGCILSGVTIKDNVNESKEVYVKSNSKITLNDGCSIKRLEALAQANNIQIVNNGTIESLNLGSMFYSTMIDFPQIYIVNYGIINELILPTWSQVFKSNNGVYSGNTEIVCYMGSVLENFIEVNGFKNSDIIYEGSSIFVESIDGSHERLRVNFKNKQGIVTTLESLLREYFISEGYASNVVGGCVSRIKELEINAISGKVLTSTDINYLKKLNFSSLEVLNLENANLMNNTLAKSSLTIFTLKKVILPKNLQKIESSPFGDKVTMDEIVIPESVSEIAQNGLLGVKFGIFTSSNIPSVDFGDKGTYAQEHLLGCSYVFVPESEVFSFEKAYNIKLETDSPFAADNYKNYSSVLYYPIYPISTLADDGMSYVRKLADGTYEIVFLDLESNKDKIVDNKFVVGADLTINNQPIVVSQVGRYAIYKQTILTLELSFAETIHTVGHKAVAETDIYSVDFVAVENYGCSVLYHSYIDYLDFTKTTAVHGYYPFYSTYAKYIDLGTIERIDGNYCFAQSTKLIELDTGNNTYLNSGSFQGCTKLVRVNAPNLVESRSVVFNNCTSLVEAYLPSISIISANVFNGCINLVYLQMGNNNFTEINTQVLDNTPALKYLYIGGLKNNAILTIDRLKNGNPIIDNVFVNVSKYDNYCSNANYSDMKNNFREYGVAVGDYTINVKKDGENPYYLTIGDYTVRIDDSKGYITACHYLDEDIPEEYTIPSSLTVNGKSYTIYYLSKRSFYGMNIAPLGFSKITRVFPYAFYDCDKIQTIYANKMVRFDDYSFAECDNLATLNIPAVEKIYGNAFYNCPSLTNIYLEKQLTIHSENAFSGTTTNIKRITIGLSGEMIDSTVFSKIANKNVDLCVLSSMVSTYSSDSVFSKFNIVGIDASVDYVNSAGTSTLATYFLKKIGEDASGKDTYEIISLKLMFTRTIIPNSSSGYKIVSSREGVFDNLALTRIVIPDSYESVKEGEFSKVVSLNELAVNSGNTKYKGVDGVLYSKSGKELICYPNAKTDVDFTIPSTTEVISNSAFKNAKYLENLTITSNVKVLGEGCFENANIKTITFESTTPPYLTSSNIFNTSVKGFKIYVPAGSLSAYTSSNEFSKYSEYIEGQ